MFPLRFRDSSGTPCRIIAEFDTEYSDKTVNHVYSDAIKYVTSIFVLTLALIVSLLNYIKV